MAFYSTDMPITPIRTNIRCTTTFHTLRPVLALNCQSCCKRLSRAATENGRPRRTERRPRIMIPWPWSRFSLVRQRKSRLCRSALFIGQPHFLPILAVPRRTLLADVQTLRRLPQAPPPSMRVTFSHRHHHPPPPLSRRFPPLPSGGSSGCRTRHAVPYETRHPVRNGSGYRHIPGHR